MPSASSGTEPSPEDLLDDAEAEQAERVRYRARRAMRELKAENEILHRRVDVLEEHLEVRDALREKIRKPPIIDLDSGSRNPKSRSGADPIIPIAIQSDEHYDEEFTLAQTGGINEQTPEIAEEKVHTYVKRLGRLIEREAFSNPVPCVVTPFLGDMMAGELHAKDERVSSMTPIEAARFAYRMKRIIIDSLLAMDIPRLVIPCVDGNHGRSTAKRTPGLNQRYSHEHDVYLRLAEFYADKGEDRVEFYIPEADWAVLTIAENEHGSFTICCGHGDSVRGGSGVGRLFPPLLNAVSKWRQSNPADLYIIGHHHQYIETGDAVVNPCAVGYNPFAYSIGLPPGEYPTGAQLFTTVHTGRMRRATTAPIWVR